MDAVEIWGFTPYQRTGLADISPCLLPVCISYSTWIFLIFINHVNKNYRPAEREGEDMSPQMIGLLAIIAFIVLIMLRMPIAIALAVVGLVGFSIITTPNAALKLIATEIYTMFGSYTLSVIPMFILMGFLAYHAGLGQKLFTVAHRIVGRIPGGLAMSSVLACMVFGAVCGSSPATAATISSIAIPEMKKYNYGPSLATASIAAAGFIGTMIPPSVIFIIYGTQTEQPVSRLFLAGILPGLLLASLYIITIWIMTRVNPSLSPKIEKTESDAETKKPKMGGLGGLIEVGIIFAISLGGLFAGWFTPTEAGGIGAAGVLVVTLIRRQLSWKGIAAALRATTRTTAMIMLLVAGATIFSRLMAVSRIPFELAGIVESLPLPDFVILLIVLVIYILLGTILDNIPMILLTIPIFYPVVVDGLGKDPIWFGVVILMAASIGVISPPVGINVYVVKGVAKDVPVEVIFRGAIPFVIAALVACMLVVIFPNIVTFLPYWLLGR